MTLDLVGDVLILVGVVVFAVGALGLLRLPDVYSRLSGVTMAAGLGIILILLGVLLHHPTVANTLKVALAVLVQLATAAVGGNAMARAGYLTHARRTQATYYDDLADAEADPPALTEE